MSFVTRDYGQADGITLRGIRVFKAYASEDGIRGLRFVHPRWSGLWAAMARANADAYYQRTAECETGQVALWCCLHGRRFIFAAASDPDCDPSLSALKSWTDRVLYRIGLRLAHAVTAQTTTQQCRFQRDMGIESVLIRNCGRNLAACASCAMPPSSVPGPIRVLWVGRMTREKRLEWLLDVAGQCPEITFEVVGGANADSDYASPLIRRAAGIANIHMHGWVPHSEIIQYYQRCHVLCCTSAYEGFPNTFLEAWSLGVPVVSTFDPDSIISMNGLGWVARDVDELAACLRQIVQSPQSWLTASKAARQYYLANHTEEACLPRFERLFRELVRH